MRVGNEFKKCPHPRVMSPSASLTRAARSPERLCPVSPERLQDRDTIGKGLLVAAMQPKEECPVKGVRAGTDVAIPPPRPKRKPLRPYPHKSSSGTRQDKAASMSNPENVPMETDEDKKDIEEHGETILKLFGKPVVVRKVSSSSASHQDKGSPASVPSATQFDASGSSMSNPESPDDVPPTSLKLFGKSIVVSCSSGSHLDKGSPVPVLSAMQSDAVGPSMSNPESLHDVPPTSLKLFGKSLVVADAAGLGNSKKISSQSSNKATSSQAPPAAHILAAPPNPYRWAHPYPLHLGEAPLHMSMRWPYYGRPPTAVPRKHDKSKSPPVGSSSDGGADSAPSGSTKWRLLSYQPTMVRVRAEAKPNSAFMRAKAGDEQLAGKWYVEPNDREKVFP